MILRARAVVPIIRPPVLDGAVVVSGNRITAIGRWRELRSGFSGQVIDLGETILMPGLINAHCHLDYTHMAGQLPPPKRFTDWLKLITSTKAGWNATEYTASWLSGTRMLIHNGTTTVGDVEAVPQLLPAVWDSVPLRVFSFLEMIGITARRPPRAVLSETLQKIQSLDHDRCVVGLSPHAPYSTVPQLLQGAAQAAQQNSWLLCVHVAESQTEFAMFKEAKGEMFDWLRRSGRDMSDCGSVSPVMQLERCGLLMENLLAVHANYLARGDASLLARRRVNVIHCPRSHAYFRHDPFPLERLLQVGVNVCLGTDSLASVLQRPRQTIELDMFAEMRQLAHDFPFLSTKAILGMATINGARALGQRGRLGQLSNGACADLIALPLAGKPKRLTEAVLEHRGAVSASMINGKWAIPPK
jgi:cytosine/adenosine deaminase-related metal-dependent hydrolase